MSSKMTMVLLPIIWMTLFKVEASYDRSSHYKNVVSNSIPSNVPPNYPDYTDPWIEIKKAQLERARIRGQEARNGYGLRDAESKSLNASLIQSKRKRHTMPPQRRDQSKKLVYYRCYFNVVSCF